MKAQSIIAILFSTLIISSSCKKNDITTPSNPGSQKGAVTEKGTPVGDAVSKSIGSEGGVITSADGNITVTIPASAVSSATTFSVQSITNKTPNGIGLAYRLLPEGTRFNKPVTITFHYDDSVIIGLSPDLLHVAFQDTSGIWLAKKDATLNINAKTISVLSSHFSDWSSFSTFILEQDETDILPSESDDLTVKEVQLLGAVDNEDEPLDTTITDKNVKWTLVYNEGHLYPSGNTHSATYIAPENVPNHNPVVASAEIDNIENNEGTNGKVILFAYINVVSEIMSINLDGDITTYSTCKLYDTSGTTLIQGGPSEDTLACIISIAGADTGSYHFTVGSPINNSVIVTDEGKAYFNGYSDCSDYGLKCTAGTITINNWADKGKYISGSVSGTLATGYRCAYQFKQVYITFRALHKSNR